MERVEAARVRTPAAVNQISRFMADSFLRPIDSLTRKKPAGRFRGPRSGGAVVLPAQYHPSQIERLPRAPVQPRGLPQELAGHRTDLQDERGRPHAAALVELPQLVGPAGDIRRLRADKLGRSEEHTSEL